MNDWVFDNVILQVEVGSTAHGTGLLGAEDYDNIAIVLEPERYRLGFEKFETRVHRPGRSMTEKSGPGDWDLTVHSLHKWMRLAMQGNPSILMALWAPVITASRVGYKLREMAPLFIGRHLAQPFLGYAEAQRQKLTGERGGMHTNRPELVEQYGYDTKYAMHMLRLGFQGREVLTTGAIQYPAKQQELLTDVRMGRYALGDVLTMARVNEKELKQLATRAPVAAGANGGALQDWLISTYKDFYSGDFRAIKTKRIVEPSPSANGLEAVLGVEGRAEVASPDLGHEVRVHGVAPHEGDGPDSGGRGHGRVEHEVQDEPHVHLGAQGHSVHDTQSTPREAHPQDIVKSTRGDK